ncbi:chromosome segregation ATPase [Geobacillus subterraneus]
MSEELFAQVLDRLNAMDGTLQKLVEGQERLEREQIAIRQEQEEIRKEQQEIRKEQQEIRLEQQRLRQEQDSLRAGQKELNGIVAALLHRQDETDTKLEALAADVHHLHQEFASLKQTVDRLEQKMDSRYEQLAAQIEDIKLDLNFIAHRTVDNERIIYKLKEMLFR